jgi:radical SAM protein with 4Fe4S-binding SPASM domain
MFKFFNEEDLVKKSIINFGFVNELDTGYYDLYPYDRGKLSEVREKIFSSVKGKKKLKIELSSIESNLLKSHNVTGKILGQKKYSSLMGACFFDSRLFVDADGRFHICEKINDKFSFGSADEGFDYQKMVTMVTGYTKFLKKNCSKCDYNFLCQRCYIHFAKNGIFRMDEDFCKSQKFSARRILEELIDMQVVEAK